MGKHPLRHRFDRRVNCFLPPPSPSSSSLQRHPTIFMSPFPAFNIGTCNPDMQPTAPQPPLTPPLVVRDFNTALSHCLGPEGTNWQSLRYQATDAPRIFEISFHAPHVPLRGKARPGGPDSVSVWGGLTTVEARCQPRARAIGTAKSGRLSLRRGKNMLGPASAPDVHATSAAPPGQGAMGSSKCTDPFGLFLA